MLNMIKILIYVSRKHSKLILWSRLTYQYISWPTSYYETSWSIYRISQKSLMIRDLPKFKRPYIHNVQTKSIYLVSESKLS